MKDEALKLALEALEDLQRQYSIYPNSFWDWSKGRKAITAIKQARALDKKAENARELGLDYEPVLDVSLIDEGKTAAPVQEPVAYLFTNVQSGDIESSTDPDYKEGEREMWFRERLVRPAAQPTVQEPVAWMAESKNGNVRFTNIGQSADQLESFGWTIFPLCVAPFQFQPLTEEAVLECWKQVYEPGRREHDNATRMARAIEAAHGITKGQS
jgi:hypothetical protein